MPAIEFVGLPDEPAAPEQPWRAPIRPGRRMVAPLLWTGAATASVAASFGTVYAIGDATGIGTQRLDGWGRPSIQGFDEVGFHGPRYGIVLVIAAAALVVASALALRPRWNTRVASGIALVTVGALAAELAAVYLVVDNYRDLIHRSTIGAGDGPSVRLGAFFWWGLVAIILAVAGLVTHRRSADEPRSAPAVDPEPAHPGDESLPTG